MPCGQVMEEEARAIYTPQVMDHFMNPRNSGEIACPDGVGVAGGGRCGDVTKIYIKVESGVIADVRFKTFGCAAAIAASSVTTELVRGRTVAEARAVTADVISDALGGLPESKRRCAALAEEALCEALSGCGEHQDG